MTNGYLGNSTSQTIFYVQLEAAITMGGKRKSASHQEIKRLQSLDSRRAAV